MRVLVCFALLSFFAQSAECQTPSSPSEVPTAQTPSRPVSPRSGKSTETTLKSLNFGEKAPIVCSIEMELSSVKAIWEEVKSKLAPAGITSDVFRGLLRDSVDVYFILRIKGEPQPFIIPEVFPEASDRTVLSSFVVPGRYEGKEFLLEVWDDDSDSDAFWRALASRTKLKLKGKGDVTAVVRTAGTPVKAGVGGELSVEIDGEPLGNITLNANDFVGQVEGKFPKADTKKEDRIWSAVNVGVGIKIPYPRGVIELENHGPAQLD